MKPINWRILLLLDSAENNRQTRGTVHINDSFDRSTRLSRSLSRQAHAIVVHQDDRINDWFFKSECHEIVCSIGFMVDRNGLGQSISLRQKRSNMFIIAREIRLNISWPNKRESQVTTMSFGFWKRLIDILGGLVSSKVLNTRTNQKKRPKESRTPAVLESTVLYSCNRD